MTSDIDFIYHGPLYNTSKWLIHPQNHESRHKPLNVLWTSPANPETGEAEWINWCRRENYKVDFYEQKRLHIVPHKDCKILTLLPESPGIDKYTIVNRFGWKVLDFEAIAKDYDALYIPEDTIREHNWGLLDSWDVPTCIFLAPKYTVLDDEMYALYKAGKLKLEDNQYTPEFNPQMNLHPRALPPLSFVRPLDDSVANAIQELRQMSNKSSNKRKASLYDEVIQELEKHNSFDLLNDLDNWRFLNYPDVLHVFLKHGMNPNMKVKVLGSACPITDTIKNEESFKLMLQYGADPNALLANLLKFGRSTQGVRLCLAAGANINFADNEGVTQLMKAWKTDHVELLLSAGANPLAVDKKGKSVQEYFEEQAFYKCRVLNCKMLNMAKNNLFVHEKMDSLRATLQRKNTPKDKETKTKHGNSVLNSHKTQKTAGHFNDSR